MLQSQGVSTQNLTSSTTSSHRGWRKRPADNFGFSPSEERDSHRTAVAEDGRHRQGRSCRTRCHGLRQQRGRYRVRLGKGDVRSMRRTARTFSSSLSRSGAALKNKTSSDHTARRQSRVTITLRFHPVYLRNTTTAEPRVHRRFHLRSHTSVVRAIPSRALQQQLVVHLKNHSRAELVSAEPVS